jgi:hypothetical protein
MDKILKAKIDSILFMIILSMIPVFSIGMLSEPKKAKISAIPAKSTKTVF